MTKVVLRGGSVSNLCLHMFVYGGEDTGAYVLPFAWIGYGQCVLYNSLTIVAKFHPPGGPRLLPVHLRTGELAVYLKESLKPDIDWHLNIYTSKATAPYLDTSSQET